MSKVYCLVGGSGAGKDTIRELLPLPSVISYRTRPIRSGEVHGVHGYFVDESSYIYAKENGMIAAYTFYNGYHYWTEKRQFQHLITEGIPVVYVVDRAGVESLRDILGNDKVCAIWIEVPEQTLEYRMRKRGDLPEKVDERIQYHREIVEYEKRACNRWVDDYSYGNFTESPHVIAGRVSQIILDDLYGEYKQKRS